MARHRLAAVNRSVRLALHGLPPRLGSASLALIVATHSVHCLAQGFPSKIELSSLDGSNGLVLHGVNDGDGAGTVGGAGDVNGDGIADVTIGAALYGASGEGQGYVVYGHEATFPRSFALSSLDGTNDSSWKRHMPAIAPATP